MTVSAMFVVVDDFVRLSDFVTFVDDLVDDLAGTITSTRCFALVTGAMTVAKRKE